MTTYEQLTFDGILEVIDQGTGELRARKILFTCERDCTLCGVEFMAGEEVEVTFPASIDLMRSPGRGPWEPGGRSPRWLRSKALQIVEVSRDKVIYQSGKK